MRFRSRVQVGATALVAAVLAAGCGTATANNSPAAPASKRAGSPVAGTRAQAQSLAQSLLAELNLPAGTRREPAPAIARFRQAAPIFGPSGVNMTRRYSATKPAAAVTAFLDAHPPAGTVTSGSGTANGANATVFQQFYPRHLPAGIYQAALSVSVTGQRGGSQVTADVHVVWYPARTAAEFIAPAKFRSVTVTADILNPHFHTVVKTFGASEVAKLAGILNGLHASPAGLAISCPAELTTYKLVFQAKSGGQPVTVTGGGCLVDDIRVGARTEPSLIDPKDGITMAASALLHVSAKHGPVFSGLG